MWSTTSHHGASSRIHSATRRCSHRSAPRSRASVAGHARPACGSSTMSGSMCPFGGMSSRRSRCPGRSPPRPRAPPRADRARPTGRSWSDDVRTRDGLRSSGHGPRYSSSWSDARRGRFPNVSKRTAPRSRGRLAPSSRRRRAPRPRPGTGRAHRDRACRPARSARTIGVHHVPDAHGAVLGAGRESPHSAERRRATPRARDRGARRRGGPRPPTSQSRTTPSRVVVTIDRRRRGTPRRSRRPGCGVSSAATRARDSTSHTLTVAVVEGRASDRSVARPVRRPRPRCRRRR